jgi:2-isopropylmalate synthase
MRHLKLYDTTLRDGAQSEGISFTVEDKIRIALLLDEFGIHYIEGGWPGSNPKDIEFFQKAKTMRFRNAVITAFGSTRRPRIKADRDQNLHALLSAGTPIVTIFGKSWDFQVKEALKTTLAENLFMIRDSIKFLKSKGKTVFYDAEHFFDGYKSNPAYALKTLKTAKLAGAQTIILCDTNGGTLPHEISKITETVRKKTRIPLGIHTHNDCELAVANSIAAVVAGADQVQGTINGYGERCGNANLCSIAPIIKYKLGIECIIEEKIKKLSELSHQIAEIANLQPDNHQPFVGRSAFSHKGGVHASAVLRHPSTYEHLKPELVGNSRKIVVSELSGASNLIHKAKDAGINLHKDTPEVKNLLEKIKGMEHFGYQFEDGEASFELLLKRALGEHRHFFNLEGFRVISEEHGENKFVVEATIKVLVNNKLMHTAAEGNGPVAALDHALRKALENFYPAIKKIKLIDYKVRVLDSKDGTDAKVRVIVTTSDGKKKWNTVGVSTNIIEASWHALVDSIEYKLIEDAATNAG